MAWANLLEEAEVVFIAVDTPQGEDGSADLSSVAAVARDIGRALSRASRQRPLLVVNKSTVPVGSGDYVSMSIEDGAEEADVGKADFVVVSNPESSRDGSAIYDSLFPDRIVVGADSREALDTLRALYEPIIEQSFPTELDPRPKIAVPFVTTDLASAEMIKYAANAFLATKISFINEIANLCELVGADVSEVAYSMGLDERIGSRFLSAGIGWGLLLSQGRSRFALDRPRVRARDAATRRNRRGERPPAQAGHRQAAAGAAHLEGQARSALGALLQAQHR